ncbi:hypothetical protein [Methylobacterium persicinum]|uniref:Uncharacterized protein n=1 Tax=Methylobacterium persicinum TaxID=374426 RepID=A0ABU0HSD9_9HYPH|nr:hypothetical protein [Methylobacterium persicinum]MDQ0445247.1 hypothetical protein [Methylobacterium persicinum]GJE37871.1 hypothetical protein KHHGKMAE_1933 [Methylobacterium persicinum]
MPRWDHTLKLKELWMDDEHDDGDDNALATRVAPVAAERVRALAKKVEGANPILSDSLEEIADGFADVPDCDKPKKAFNWTLDELYDLADGNRIWIA